MNMLNVQNTFTMQDYTHAGFYVLVLTGHLRGEVKLNAFDENFGACIQKYTLLCSVVSQN